MRANKKTVFLLFGIFFISLVSISASASHKFSCCLECIKDGPLEVTSEASGKAVFLFDEDKQELSYKLQVEKIRDAYMAHLHVGSSQKQGPIAVWLYPNHNHAAADRMKKNEYSGILAEGVVRPEDLEEGISFAELIEAMQQGRAYVNVHTKKYIPGEIGGQVKPAI